MVRQMTACDRMWNGNIGVSVRAISSLSTIFFGIMLATAVMVPLFIDGKVVSFVLGVMIASFWWFFPEIIICWDKKIFLEDKDLDERCIWIDGIPYRVGDIKKIGGK